MTEGQPAIAGDSVKPGVERSGTPGDLHELHSKPAKRSAASSMRSRCHIRYRPLRGLCKVFEFTVPGVPLRSTPGSTLSPATAGWDLELVRMLAD